MTKVMNDKNVHSKIEDLTKFLSEEINSKLGKRVHSLMYVGSYAKGKISKSRPDINYVLIWEVRGTADDYLTLGKILTEATSKFLKHFVIRPEFRPFKFGYPIQRKMYEVFINISCLNSVDNNQKFFLPDYVLDGFKHSRKMIFGTDVFGNMEFNVTKQGLLAGAMQKLASHKIQLDRIPLVYNLDKDIDLVFNESLDHGKNLAYFGVEVAMSEEEIKKKDYLTVIEDKSRLLEFYEQGFPPPATAALKIILDSRDHYREWKNDWGHAVEVYKAAFMLHGLLAGLVEKQI